ncbi:MAG: thioredoxin domain-containing protein [Thermoleophilia bacterium]|nr:thioredoxin domain-containing protein [Thermoleophilia bacterium]
MAKDEAPGSAKFFFSPRPNRAHEIDWMEWGDEAFRRAREEKRPILLSVSAVWCHWCHVMDETTFSDGQVIQVINSRFVGVRVDSDRRPDINSRYNQGGWPTVAFLTHEGEIIAGTTYVPPDQMGRLLNDVADVFERSAADLDAAIEYVRERRNAPAPVPGGGFDASMVDYVVDVAEKAYDSEAGGFGNEPKFLYAGMLGLLLSRLAADAPGNIAGILRHTLEKMAYGNIYDQSEGGFFRYSTTRDWSVPHYEKLLEDNAAMMTVYADAFNLSGEADYARTVYGIHDYLTKTLLDPGTGAFAGSQDADEEYYRLAADERTARKPPLVDRTVYSGLNARTASALLRAFQVLEEVEFRSQAIKALEFVYEHLWDDDAGPYHYFNGEANLPGLLTDAAWILSACLDAYESGAGERWLDRALRVAGWMLGHLQDHGSGAFLDCVHPPGSRGLPSEKTRPPVDNSVAADGLIRLAQNSGQKKYDEAARRALLYFSGTFQEYGMFAAEYAVSVARLLDPPVRVTVVGTPDDAATVELIRGAHRARIPFRSVEVIDPEAYGDELEETGYGYTGTPVAYACIGTACQPPVSDPKELSARLEAGWTDATARWGQA